MNRLVMPRAFICLGLLLPSAALAQDLVVDRHVVADFFQGPVVASGRVVGLGGAYVGVAEGAEGHLANPAAFAVRGAPFAHDWFDWDVTFSTLSVTRDQQIDVGQSGQQSFDAARFVQAGFNLKFGEHGFGIQLQNQEYDRRLILIGQPENTVTVRQTYLGLGYGQHLVEGLWIGGLLYGGSAELAIDSGQSARVNGGGFLFGGLYAPPGERWRLGATARSSVVGQDVQAEIDPTAIPSGLQVPDAVAVPWQLGLGASYVLGPRGGNVAPTFGRGEAPPAPGDRRYVLLALDLVLTGPAPEGAVGPDALSGVGDRQSGRYVSASLRAGAEAEVWADVLVVRAGSYFEPDRYAAFDGRLHLTAGADVHLGELIWDWEVGAVVDWAPAYLNWGFGLGFWY